MSEYQYYEFQAIDRPLFEKDREALRDISTRARITSTSFTNEYSWGNFKGNPLKLMEKYFDAFLYVANWGTHRFMLRIPRKLINLDMARQYCIGDSAVIHEKGDYLIFEFTADTEDYEWVEGEGYLSSLISLRSDLIRGDYRCLYLAWLFCCQMDEVGYDDEDEDEYEHEPPVPPDLGNLNASLESFVNFMRIDTDLIAVAAENSAAEQNPVKNDQLLKHWVSGLDSSEKDKIVFRLISDNDPHLGNELLQRFKNTLSDKSVKKRENKPRVVSDLIEKAESYAKERQQQIAEQKTREKAHQEKEAAKAREKYLNDLAKRENDAWGKVDSLIKAKKSRDYDTAVKLLVDLRDISKKNNTTRAFKSKVGEIRKTHDRKAAMIRRMDAAGL